jgi:hypothetical protein
VIPAATEERSIEQLRETATKAQRALRARIAADIRARAALTAAKETP